jgi:hypothetical protein
VEYLGTGAELGYTRSQKWINVGGNTIEMGRKRNFSRPPLSSPHPHDRISLSSPPSPRPAVRRRTPHLPARPLAPGLGLSARPFSSRPRPPVSSGSGLRRSPPAAAAAVGPPPLGLWASARPPSRCPPLHLLPQAPRRPRHSVRGHLGLHLSGVPRGFQEQSQAHFGALGPFPNVRPRNLLVLGLAAQ